MATILIIDDDPVTLAMLSDILATDGHKTLQATDGKAGVDLLKRHPTDIVITDIYMPVKDGIETIMEIKKYETAPKIIAITAGSDRGGRLAPTLEIAKELGAQKVLLKPVDADELLLAIKEIIA